MTLLQRLLPILAAVLGVGFLSLMDAFMKGAALAAGAYSASVLRSLIGAGMIGPFWLASGAGWPKAPVMKLHIERGIVSAFMALAFFYALTKLPIAEAIAISFIAPLIALYLARILLGEEIKAKAVLASILGFGGCLVIIGGKIGSGDFDRDTGLGLAALLFSAVLYAYNFIVIRKQAQLASPVEIATFHSGIGGLIQLLAAPLFFMMPQIDVLGEIAIASALTVCGAMAIAWAYARAEAQVLVPFEYTGFLWAALFGWIFFQEQVTLATIGGVILIVVGCLIAAQREKRPPPPEQTAI